jgi:hypothetical protein
MELARERYNVAQTSLTSFAPSKRTAQASSSGCGNLAGNGRLSSLVPLNLPMFLMEQIRGLFAEGAMLTLSSGKVFRMSEAVAPLTAVALVASYLLARGAARLAPISALRGRM